MLQNYIILRGGEVYCQIASHSIEGAKLVALNIGYKDTIDHYQGHGYSPSDLAVDIEHALYLNDFEVIDTNNKKWLLILKNNGEIVNKQKMDDNQLELFNQYRWLSEYNDLDITITPLKEITE